jgi:hypothetical protein
MVGEALRAFDALDGLGIWRANDVFVGLGTNHVCQVACSSSFMRNAGFSTQAAAQKLRTVEVSILDLTFCCVVARRVTYAGCRSMSF